MGFCSIASSKLFLESISCFEKVKINDASGPLQ